ncbi:hypothetical protein ABZ835_43995 [Streptomyces sp. NPDC047461]|uniref:Rv1733c family protein n=1 Tax=Streptomyces sp. NPDC047461 TaxID=3155619 RepID=UPI0033E34EF8
MANERRAKMARVRYWRWRRNPLRRRSDRVEAWIVLVAWILAALGGLLTGRAVMGSVEDGLAARRAALHSLSAVLTEDAPKSQPLATSGTSDVMVWAKVRWSTADGAAHTDLARVGPGTSKGTSVTVWADRTGRLVRMPVDATEARLEAVLMGGSAGFAAGGVALGAGWLVRRWLDRRRMAEWAAEWEKVGPQWRKRMSG